MAQAKYVDSAMLGNNGVFGGGDELIIDEFFPEFAEEDLRLRGGVYGEEAGYMEMDEFSAEDAIDYGPSPHYEEPKFEALITVVHSMEKTIAASVCGLMPILMVGGAAVCDPLNLF